MKDVITGSTMGRYVVIDQVGAGGMGVVYKAYDPELDRRVALKLLRESGSEEARNRLLREAQALARLAHPNVVSVHDVGTYDDQVFLAMDFVEGLTLREWLSDAKHTSEEIVQVFAQAGRGLAAAHSCDVVHRDFKVDNVIVGTDARVHLLDFGLARDVGNESEDNEDFEMSPLKVALTSVGRRMGTPAYMAPEQHKRQAVDARTDQFAFCASLYEALYEERAFAGKRYQEFARNVCDGVVSDPPKNTKVPMRFRAALLRGLQPLPDDRYASMDDLLTELAYDPKVRNRRLAIGGALVVLAGVAGYGALRSVEAPPPLCRNAERHLAGVWDATARANVEASFKATKRGHAAESFGRVSQRLDDYTNNWVSTRTQTCEATHVHGEQPESDLGLRMRCLDRLLLEVSSLVSVFADLSDPATLDRVTQAVYELSPPSNCDDVEALAAVIPPPLDPAHRENVANLETSLEKARAFKRAGRYEEGLALAQSVAPRSTELSYKPLLAESLFVLGDLQLQTSDANAAEKTLTEALVASGEAHTDSLTAQILSRLVYVIGYQQSRLDEGLAVASVARAAIARANNPIFAGELGVKLALLHKEKGELEAAEVDIEDSLQHWSDVLSEDHPYVTNAISDLAGVKFAKGDVAAAKELLERTVASQRRSLGSQHPFVGGSLGNLGIVAMRSGDLELAQEYFEQTQGILEASLGSEHPQTAQAFAALGDVALKRKRPKEALELSPRALTVFEKARGPEHPALTQALNGIGESAQALERTDEAVAAFERMLAIRVNAKVDALKIASARFALARALTPKDMPRALALAQTAKTAFDAEGPRAKSNLAEVVVWLQDRR